MNTHDIEVINHILALDSKTREDKMVIQYYNDPSLVGIGKGSNQLLCFVSEYIDYCREVHLFERLYDNNTVQNVIDHFITKELFEKTRLYENLKSYVQSGFDNVFESLVVEDFILLEKYLGYLKEKNNVNP